MKRAAITFAAIALCAAPPLSAQRAQRRVYVAAADGNGTPVLNLSAGDFQVLENGARREVLRATRGTGPMRIALVVDSSGAVSPLLNNIRAGLTTFLDELPGEHEITFITTGGQIRIRQPVTTDRQKLKTAGGLFASDGGANSLIETLIEADRRFLNAPGQWPVFVILTTDQGGAASEPTLDRFNRFVKGFVERGGAAHAIVMHGNIRTGGIITNFVANVVKNTGGFYESMAIANVLPDKMKMLAEHIDANYKAMANWYELEFASDGRTQSPRVEVATSREGVSVQMSGRRPF